MMESREVNLFYKRLQRHPQNYSLSRRQQDVLADLKWQLLLKRARLFRHLPFIEFVLGSGSMSLGNVTPTSDFDVVISTRSGRIFTTRAFILVLFSLRRWRRRRSDNDITANNKFCFNHFITPATYTLAPPYNIYWQEIYKHFVPIFGSDDIINKFLHANPWAGSLQYQTDLRHRYYKSTPLALFFEYILSNRFGNWLETRLKNIQIKKIKNSLMKDNGLSPRIKYDDIELEFHPDQTKFVPFIDGL